MRTSSVRAYLDTYMPLCTKEYREYEWHSHTGHRIDLVMAIELRMCTL